MIVAPYARPVSADAVVRRLGDRARDVRAVAVVVVGIGVLAIARRRRPGRCARRSRGPWRSGCGFRSGRALEVAAGPRTRRRESSTAILTPLPPGLPALNRLSHARGASTPVPGQEVPLIGLPAGSADPGIVGNPRVGGRGDGQQHSDDDHGDGAHGRGTRVVREVTRVTGPSPSDRLVSGFRCAVVESSLPERVEERRAAALQEPAPAEATQVAVPTLQPPSAGNLSPAQPTATSSRATPTARPRRSSTSSPTRKPRPSARTRRSPRATP